MFAGFPLLRWSGRQQQTIILRRQKGRRYILPNAEVMIHQPMGGVEGQATDIAITAKHILKQETT